MECKRLPTDYEIRYFSLKVVFLYSMKIKEQTRKLAVGSTWVRQGETDVVWIWFSKSISPKFWFNSLLKTPKNLPNGQVSVLYA